MSEEQASAGGKNPPVKKREIFGWAMYDFASSSYTTVVISVVYSTFFTQYIVPPGSAARDTYWSIAIILSTILALTLSPFVGAICDYSGGKKKYLGLSALMCAISTASLYLVAPGNIWLGIAFVAVSNAAFMIGESFCGSFLTDLATRDNMGVISGLGWGLGYFGGLASLLLVRGTVSANPDSDLALYIAQNQMAMVVMGVFFLCAALPTFLLVKERSEPAPGFEDAGLGKLMAVGFKELKQSYALAREYDVLFKFFIAFTAYMAGLEVIIKFVGIYATQELKLTQDDLVKLFLILQISAAAGALGFGFLETKLGAKRTVLLTIVWWILGGLSIFFLENIAALVGSTPVNVFLVIAIVAGSGMGSIQSSSRAVVGLLSPEGRSAQMFGFWGMFARLAIIFGMTFGPVADAVGRRYALLLVIGFFVVGGILTMRVPFDRGIREAREAAERDALAKDA